MKITDIKTYPVWTGHRHFLVVKVETDEGLYGLGEGGMTTRELAVKGAVEHYREWLIGRDPMRIGALWQEMYRSQYFEGGRVLTSAISAIDIALHDIAGKALGVPVYQLLGGKHRDYVPCFVTTGGASYEELRDNATHLIEQGWKVLRLSMAQPNAQEDPALFEPRESIPLTAEWMTRLRQEVGLGPVLGVEYHHRLSVAEAASFCQRMPKGTLDFLEEPIRDECPEAYEALRRMTDVPFAIGEEFASKWQFLPYIERGITNFARVDVCNVGGLTEAKKVAGWAEAHYIDLMPHNPLGPVCTAASVHLAAAVPNFAWLEIWVRREGERRPADNLFPVQPRL
ncbi:MAG: mandelate racemase/muconate lactonizing enzyme family protein, partial [Chloroflexi bacterium]|nr:mandelate racemase/muconate lactonizing enzyme family protein [Chloroflexota bacterium]